PPQGPVESGPVEGVRFGAAEVEAVDPRPPAGQALAGHPTVGAVVALAADDDHPPAVGAAEETPGPPGDGPTGPVDERGFAHPAGDGGGVTGGHLGRSEHWKHPMKWYGRRSHPLWTLLSGSQVRGSAPPGWNGGTVSCEGEVTELGVVRPGRLRAMTRLLGL